MRALEEKRAMENRAAELGLLPEQIPGERTMNCLDESAFDEKFLAKVDHLRSCATCREKFELHYRAYNDRKNPITLGFKPSAAYVAKLKEALNAYGIAVQSPKNLGKIRALHGDSILRYVILRTYSASSSKLPSFVLIKDEEFAKEGRKLLDGSLNIPPTEEGKEVHKLLAREFIAWLGEHGGDLNVGHHVLKRLKVEGDSVIGYVAFNPLENPVSQFSKP